MAVLREGTKVKTTDGLIGHVEARYDLGSVVYYIVKIEDGSLYKYFEDQLTEIEEEPAPEEPTGSDSITITREEFVEKASKGVAHLMKELHSPELIFVAPFICCEIEKTLFGERPKNV